MSGRRSGAWIWLAILAGVLLIVVLTPDGVAPYGLDSADSTGYRGLRLLLEQTGTRVRPIDAAAVPDVATPGGATVFVPVADGADASQVRRWRRFVDSGGRLVLGTPTAGLGAAASSGASPSGTAVTGRGECDIAELRSARAVEGMEFATPLEATGRESCFGSSGSALVVRTPSGRGEVVTLADPELFSNRSLGAPGLDERVTSVPDNALVAQRLLGATDSVDVVTSGLSATPSTAGRKSIVDYLPDGVKLALLELVVAFAVYAWFRGRRHGRVVVEEAPVEIDGSAFIGAHGNLLERQSDARRAGESLRDATASDLSRRLGVPIGVPRQHLVAVVAGRTGRDPAAVAAVLAGPPVASDGELLDLSNELESLHREALHV